MKTAHGIPATALFAAVFIFNAIAAPDDEFASGEITPAFREALFAEEAEQDLETAIAGYEDVLEKYDAARRVAASAVFRLGECYRKQQDDEKAVAQYRRLLEEFPSEETLAKLSRENLAALGERDLREKPVPTNFSPHDREEFQLANIRKILAESPDLLNDTSETRVPLLLKAIHDGHVKVAEYLLKEGADPNLDSFKNGGAPLWAAVSEGNIVMIELLLANGADIDRADKSNGTTAVFIAVSKGYVDTLKVLLQHQPDLTKQAVFQVSDRLAKFKGSILHNPIVWAPALHRACYEGHTDVVKLLLEAGADPGIGAEHGLTPLHFAICSENESTREAIVKVLVERGADVNSADKHGRTPLWFAAAQLDTALVNYFLAKGADPNAADTVLANTPLYLVLRATEPESVPPGDTAKRRKALIDTLIAHDANVGKSGPSLLTHAISRFDAGLLTYFLENGGDANAIDEKTKHPLLYYVLMAARPNDISLKVAMERRLEMTKILVAHGADVNSGRDGSGRSNNMLSMAFNEAFFSSNDAEDSAAWDPIIDFFLENGADPRPVLQNQNSRRKLRDDHRALYDRLVRILHANEIGDERDGAIWADHDYDDSISNRLQKVFSPQTPSERPPRLAEFVIRTYGKRNDSSFHKRAPKIDDIIILRRVGEGRPDRVIEIDYDEIADAGDPAADPQLQWGDIVTFTWGDNGSRRDWIDYLSNAETKFLARASLLPVTVQLGEAEPRAVRVRPFREDNARPPDSFAYIGSMVAPGDFYSSSDGNYWDLFRSAGWSARPDVNCANVRIIHEGGDELVVDVSGHFKATPRIVAGDTIIVPAATASPESTERRRNGVWIACPDQDFMERKYRDQMQSRLPRLAGAIAHSFADARFVLPHPDFSKVVIRRMEEKDGVVTETRIRVDVKAQAAKYNKTGSFFEKAGEPFAAEDESANPQLEWGDIIEIPQLPGTDPADWTGLSEEIRQYLDARTRIKVFLVPEGHEPREVEIGYRFFEFRRNDFGWCHYYSDQFKLKALGGHNAPAPCLSTLLPEHLSIKEWDLSSVIVKALDGADRRVDLTKREDLLLFEGDRIEIRKQL